MAPKHRPDPYDPDLFCACGGMIVWFADQTPNRVTAYGYGCERLGRPSIAFEPPERQVW